jgi:RNA polymerase sigma-70 factor, ECF subfamily
VSSPTEIASSANFHQLLSAARNGDKEAQGRLLETFRRPLLRLARGQLNPAVRAKGGASDVVQETFVKALHDIRTFQGCTPQQLLAWLRVILTHTATNFVHRFTTGRRRFEREAARVSELTGDDARHTARSACETLIGREQACQVKELVNRLPRRYAEVIRLRCEENLSFVEIGAKIGRSAEAARKVWSRAVNDLARTMT